MELSAEESAAERIASSASVLLAKLRADIGFADPSRLRAEGDRQANELIVSELASAFPRDPVLSEEAADDLARTKASRVWIVDPLDGTREFGEEGRADFAVHIALSVDGRAAAGCVALPARSVRLSTARPPALAPDSGRFRMVVSRTRATSLVLELANALQAELVMLGSAGAKVAAVVLGEAEAYAHSGGLHEWDAAAPVAVAAAAGLHASRLDGSELTFNHPDPWIPDLLVCRPELAEQVLARVPKL